MSSKLRARAVQLAKRRILNAEWAEQRARQRQAKIAAAKLAVAKGKVLVANQQRPRPDLEAELLHRTNAERARHGLPPLTCNQQLCGTARRHAAAMADRNELEHSADLGQQVGENIACCGTALTLADVMAGWLASPGHAENIMHPTVTELGVGAVTARNGGTYFVQQFARAS